MTKWQRLRELIQRRALGPLPGRVETARVLCNGEGALLAGHLLYECTRDLGLFGLGGAGLGSLALTTAAVMAYHQADQTLEGFWIRPERKDHGSEQMIEGRLVPGSLVALVTDLAISGDCLVGAVDEVRRHGGRIAIAVALIDLNRGAQKRMRDHGVPFYRALFTPTDLDSKT